MKPYMDWPRFRLGLLIGAIYGIILNGVSYVLGSTQGIVFPGQSLGMIITMSLYFGAGWWAARDAQTQNEGVSQGLSIGLGIGIAALVIAVPLMLFFMGGNAPIPWYILIPIAIFGEMKWAFVSFVGGRMRAKKNTPLP